MPLPFLLLLLASILPPPPPASAACSPRACGDLTVDYPFWLEDGAGRPACGSPSFQLNCNGGKAFLTHSVYGQYQVVRVFVQNSSFVAVDHNLLVSPAGCPKRWFNVSDGIGLGPYTISKKNRELLVLYNCTNQQRRRRRPTPQGFLPTPCLNESFYHVGGEYGSHRGHDSGLPLPPACQLSVVPFLGFLDQDAYLGSMRQGFLLEWKLTSGDSPKCTASGGQCRYGNTSTGFSCNCSGALYPEECGELTKLTACPPNLPAQFVVLSTCIENASSSIPLKYLQVMVTDSVNPKMSMQYVVISMLQVTMELLSRIKQRSLMRFSTSLLLGRVYKC